MDVFRYDDEQPADACPACETATAPPQAIVELSPLQALLSQQSGPPVRVAVAMKFVQMCNEHSGHRGFFVGNQANGTFRGKLVEQCLPAKQEAAFNLACQCIGNYFSGKSV